MPIQYVSDMASASLTRFDAGEGVNAAVRDLLVSQNHEAPMTAGLFRLEKGESLRYTYPYDEMKLVLDGEFVLLDETGSEVHAKAGDLLYFAKGSEITFSTPSYGLGYYVGQRGLDEA